MRANDPRRPYTLAPETPVDYNALHDCRTCGTIHVLDIRAKRGEWFVVTRCRCDVYSTEAGPYAHRQSADRVRRRLYAGLPPVERAEPAPAAAAAENTRCVSWDRIHHRWKIQVRRNGRNRQTHRKTREEAIALRDQWLEEAAA